MSPDVSNPAAREITYDELSPMYANRWTDLSKAVLT